MDCIEMNQMTNILCAFSQYFTFIVIGACVGLALDAGLQRLLNNWLHRYHRDWLYPYLTAMTKVRNEQSERPLWQIIIVHPVAEELVWVIPMACLWYKHAVALFGVTWIFFTMVWMLDHIHKLPSCTVQANFSEFGPRKMRCKSLTIASLSYTIAWVVAYYGANGAKWDLAHFFITSAAPIIAHSAHNYLALKSSRYRQLRGFSDSI